MSEHVLLDEGDGPAVLLLPGLSLDERLFAPIVPHIAAAHRLVVVRIARAGSIAAMGARALAVADALGIGRFHLGGLSMGGYACLEAWRQFPARIRSLSLINTQARTDSPATRQRRNSVIRLCETGHHDRVVRPFLNRILSPRHAADPRLRDLVLAMTNDAGPDAMAEDTRAILGRGDYEDVLPIINVPSLVLSGWHDFLAPPREAGRMASIIPGAELHILDDCGHLCTLEQPRAVAHIVARFLARVDAPQAVA